MKNISQLICRIFLDNTRNKNSIQQNLIARIPWFSRYQAPNKQVKMSEIQKAEAERQQLEARVHELVDKLESKKGPGEIKVPKDAVIKSKTEKEAAAALEKLAIKEEEQKKEACSAGDKQADACKKPAEKTKGGKGGASKEAAVEKPVDVSRLDLRIGKIIEVDRHPDADALYVEKIDCGDSTGPRTVISGLVKHVPIEEMKDRFVVVLCNLKPAKMRGILSEAMVMCASTPDKVELLRPPADVKPGDRVVFDKYPGEPDAQLNPKKKIWEQVAPDIKTNEDGVATYKDCAFKVASNLEGQFTSSLKNVQIR